MHFGHAFAHLFGSDQIGSTQLIIGTKISPIGAFGALCPSHDVVSFTCWFSGG